VNQENNADHPEQGIEVPYQQLAADTMRRMIQEFVSRDGSDWAEVGCTLDDKVEQVLQQLKNKRVKVVFDLKTQTANLVPCP
jgi:hypothetical protein